MCYMRRKKAFFPLNSSRQCRVNPWTTSVCRRKKEAARHWSVPPSEALFGLVKHKTCYRFRRENTRKGFIENGVNLPSGRLWVTQGQFCFTLASASGSFEKSRACKNILNDQSHQFYISWVFFKVTSVLCINVITLVQKRTVKQKRKELCSLFLNQLEDELSETLSNAGFKL